MAVISVKELCSGVSGSVEGDTQGSEKISYSATYQVKCDSQLDGPATVMNYFRITGGLPWIGTTYQLGGEYDTGAICRSVKPSLVESSGGIFVVNCEFSSSADNQQNQNGQSNPTVTGKQTDDPTKWADQISIGYGMYSAPVEMATFIGAVNAVKLSPFLKPGAFLPVTNSKKEPLDPTFEEEYATKIIRITTIVSEYDDAFWNDYHDTINSDEITIDKSAYKFKTVIGKHYGRLRVTAESEMINGKPYYRRTLEITQKGWDRPMLDQTFASSELLRDGDVKRDGTVVNQNDLGGRLTIEVPIKDDDGLSASKPILLDGDGKELEKDKPPVSLAWQAATEKDWSAIEW